MSRNQVPQGASNDSMALQNPISIPKVALEAFEPTPGGYWTVSHQSSAGTSMTYHMGNRDLSFMMRPCATLSDVQNHCQRHLYNLPEAPPSTLDNANPQQINQTHGSSMVPNSQTHGSLMVPNNQTHGPSTMPNNQTHGPSMVPNNQTFNPFHHSHQTSAIEQNTFGHSYYSAPTVYGTNLPAMPEPNMIPLMSPPLESGSSPDSMFPQSSGDVDMGILDHHEYSQSTNPWVYSNSGFPGQSSRSAFGQSDLGEHGLTEGNNMFSPSAVGKDWSHPEPGESWEHMFNFP